MFIIINNLQSRDSLKVLKERIFPFCISVPKSTSLNVKNFRELVIVRKGPNVNWCTGRESLFLVNGSPLSKRRRTTSSYRNWISLAMMVSCRSQAAPQVCSPTVRYGQSYLFEIFEKFKLIGILLLLSSYRPVRGIFIVLWLIRSNDALENQLCVLSQLPYPSWSNNCSTNGSTEVVRLVSEPVNGRWSAILTGCPWWFHSSPPFSILHPNIITCSTFGSLHAVFVLATETPAQYVFRLPLSCFALQILIQLRRRGLWKIFLKKKKRRLVRVESSSYRSVFIWRLSFVIFCPSSKKKKKETSHFLTSDAIC